MFTQATLTEALWGAAGFIGTKTAVAMLPVPAQFKIGPAKYVTGAAAAWGVGTLSRQFMGPRIGNAMFLGGMIAVASDFVAEYIMPMLPRMGVPAGTSGLGYEEDGMLGSYVSADGGVEGAW